MKTSSINQLPMYEDADALQYGAQMAALVNALDPRVVARFASTSAANSAYGAYTSAGGVMTDGMTRVVAGDMQVYLNNQWRGTVTKSASQNTFYATTVTDTTETGIAQLSIADPGWPYILDVSAVVVIAATAGVQVNIRVRLDTITGTVVSQDVMRSPNQPAGDLVPVPLAVAPSGTLTGSHTLIVSGRRTVGSGNWNVPAGGSLLNAMIRPAFS